MARIGASGTGGASNNSGNVDGGASDSIYLPSQVINGGSASTVAEQIQIRRDSAADWTSTNPVLAQGEEGYELDTDKLKIGDGITAWNSLPYTNFGGITALTGDGTATGPNSAVLTLAAVATPGTSTKVTYNAKGLITSGTTLSSGDIPNNAANTSGTSSNVTGTVAIANGGTGQTTAPNAINALLPSQTGNSGDFLTTNGTVCSWSAGGGSGITQLTGDVTAGPGSGSQVSLVTKIQGVAVGTPTGTGNVVFSASPTLTGTIISASNTMSGTLIVPTITGITSGGAISVTGGTAAVSGAGGNASLNGASGGATGAGGAGGSVTIQGGIANGDNTQNNSGGSVTINGNTSKGSATGGTVTINSGTGGVGTSTAGATGGTTNVNGGTGGAGSATSGGGGGATLKAGSGGGGVAGGVGGQVSVTGGTGGTGSSTGGNGGAVQISGGSAGSNASASGGAITLSGAGGSSTGAGGAGGSITVSSGAAGGDNTQNNNGGSITMSIGASKGSANGAAFTQTAGTGGLGTSTVGANGGNFAINAGAGGLGSATGGTGGNVVVTSGAGGASASPGTAGIIQFFVGATEHLRVNTTQILVTSADVVVNTAGNGLQVKSGSNAKIGTATLAAGSVTVANTSVTSNSRIFVTSNTDGGTPGWLRVSAKTNGTSFVITSSSATDTSTVAWLIVESL